MVSGMFLSSWYTQKLGGATQESGRPHPNVSIGRLAVVRFTLFKNIRVQL